jgi:hypothetical protein
VAAYRVRATGARRRRMARPTVSGAAFDKFAWLKALRSDPRFSDKEVRVAMAVCTDYARRDGTGWLVDLDALAASVPGEMSRNRLKIVLQKLTHHGYLIETGRTSGGRGLTARRSHNLVPPTDKPAPQLVRVNDETRTAGVAGLSETRTSSGSNPHQQRFKPAPAAVKNVGPDLRKEPPTGTSSGTYGGSACAREVSQTPEPDPLGNNPSPNSRNGQHAANGEAPNWVNGPHGPRCLDHIMDPAPPRCHDCGEARKHNEAQRAAAEAQRAADNAAVRAAIDNCRDCDDYGRLDDLTACLKHPNFREAS